MPIRIRILISILMAIQIRIRTGINMPPILVQILPQVSHMLEYPIFRNTFSHSFPVTCFDFLIRAKDVIIKSILDIKLKLKSIVYQLFHMPGIDTGPDWPDTNLHALDADPDPDPAK